MGCMEFQWQANHYDVAYLSLSSICHFYISIKICKKELGQGYWISGKA